MFLGTCVPCMGRREHVPMIQFPMPDVLLKHGADEISCTKFNISSITAHLIGSTSMCMYKYNDEISIIHVLVYFFSFKVVINNGRHLLIRIVNTSFPVFNVSPINKKIKNKIKIKHIFSHLDSKQMLSFV